jgi:hypothetical protein
MRLNKSMHYLFLVALLISIPAHAEFGFDNGIRKPQSMMVAGNSVIDSSEEYIIEDSNDPNSGYNDGYKTDSKKNAIGMMPPITDEVIEPIMPIEPTSPSAPIATRKVFKKITPVKSQRSIADERIDDSYVQELIKNNFNFQK